ncbi:hypothetical protein C8R44DRAFT_741107 [Mycena epipterygia]|nr:hypothetical protein C8R44DRAFT_741107 [Mycena epipterygia]
MRGDEERLDERGEHGRRGRGEMRSAGRWNARAGGTRCAREIIVGGKEGATSGRKGGMIYAEEIPEAREKGRGGGRRRGAWAARGGGGSVTEGMGMSARRGKVVYRSWRGKEGRRGEVEDGCRSFRQQKVGVGNGVREGTTTVQRARARAQLVRRRRPHQDARGVCQWGRRERRWRRREYADGDGGKVVGSGRYGH